MSKCTAILEESTQADRGIGSLQRVLDRLLHGNARKPAGDAIVKHNIRSESKYADSLLAKAPQTTNQAFNKRLIDKVNSSNSTTKHIFNGEHSPHPYLVDNMSTTEIYLLPHTMEKRNVDVGLKTIFLGQLLSSSNRISRNLVLGEQPTSHQPFMAILRCYIDFLMLFLIILL